MKHFTHVPRWFEVPQMVQINSPSGRTYLTPEGNEYPSVTTALGRMFNDSEWLNDWRRRVGDEKADHILRRAGVRGTAIHDMAEKYLSNDPNWHKGHMPANLITFRSMIPFIERIDNIILLETAMYSNILKVAGTTDCIAEFDGVLSVIDFKTSRNTQDPTKYFMQEACYALMFEELFGRKISQLVTIVGDDSSPTALLHISQKKEWLLKFMNFHLL